MAPLVCRVKDESSDGETGRLPVVLSSFQLDVFVDGTVDRRLGGVPAVPTHQPHHRR